MARRQVNLLISLSLVGLFVLTFASGWAASLLGLTEFGLHKYSSLALLLFVCTHICLHLRSLCAQLRTAYGRTRRQPLRVVQAAGGRLDR